LALINVNVSGEVVAASPSSTNTEPIHILLCRRPNQMQPINNTSIKSSRGRKRVKMTKHGLPRMKRRVSLIIVINIIWLARAVTVSSHFGRSDYIGLQLLGKRWWVLRCRITVFFITVLETDGRSTRSTVRALHPEQALIRGNHRCASTALGKGPRCLLVACSGWER
jgi:hypothetical protein